MRGIEVAFPSVASPICGEGGVLWGEGAALILFSRRQDVAWDGFIRDTHPLRKFRCKGFRDTMPIGEECMRVVELPLCDGCSICYVCYPVCILPMDVYGFWFSFFFFPLCILSKYNINQTEKKEKFNKVGSVNTSAGQDPNEINEKIERKKQHQQYVS